MPRFLVLLSLALFIGAASADIPAELKKAMQRRDEAIDKVDVAVWDRLTADDFIVVSTEGKSMNKAQRLAEFKTGKPAAATPLEDLQIRRYGDTAIRTFKTGDLRVMDVWHLGKKGWQVVAVQLTSIMKK